MKKFSCYREMKIELSQHTVDVGKMEFSHGFLELRDSLVSEFTSPEVRHSVGMMVG